MIKNFPDAERYIAATPALLAAFLPLRVRWPELDGQIIDATMLRGGEMGGCYEIAFRYGGVLDEDDEVKIDRIFLDPMNQMVRDHLIRTLSLPDWMRDRPGGIPAWASAGFVACHAARVVAGLPIIVPEIESIVERLTADLAKLANPSSTIDSILLTWPEGLRVWRRP